MSGLRRRGWQLRAAWAAARAVYWQLEMEYRAARLGVRPPDRGRC